VADCQSLLHSDLDEAEVRAMLKELLTQDGDELVYDGGHTVSGIAHWHPSTH
jgi:hypothetical protein